MWCKHPNACCGFCIHVSWCYIWIIMWVKKALNEWITFFKDHNSPGVLSAWIDQHLYILHWEHSLNTLNIPYDQRGLWSVWSYVYSLCCSGVRSSWMTERPVFVSDFARRPSKHIYFIYSLLLDILIVTCLKVKGHWSLHVHSTDHFCTPETLTALPVPLCLLWSSFPVAFRNVWLKKAALLF